MQNRRKFLKETAMLSAAAGWSFRGAPPHSPAPSSPEAAQSRPALEHIVIHRDDTMYYIAPCLERLRNGDLIVTVREAHRRRREQRGHVDPTARGVLLRSRDEGRNWSGKTVFDDETFRFSQTSDVPVTQLSDGSLLINTYSHSVTPRPVGWTTDTSSYGATFSWSHEGMWTIRSADGGETWSERRPVRLPGLPTLYGRSPAVELPDHTLLLAVCGRDRRRPDYDKTWCIRSQDMGTSWHSPALVAEDDLMYFNEPTLLRLKSGKLITMMRTDNSKREGTGYLFQSQSEDDGRTWSRPFQTPIWGYPAHVLELGDGRLLCVYGYRRPPFGVRACLSRDGGGSWDIDREIVLRDDGGTGDLGYPTSVELSDGRVLTAYWFNQEREGDPKSDIRFVAGTFYRP